MAVRRDSLSGELTVDKINLLEKFAKFDEQWSPRIIAESNGQLIKLAKLEGEFLWHDHANEDELFFVVKGRLELRFRDRVTILLPGELCVVPKATEHFPVATEETWVMLIEPSSTLHTGDQQTERTVVIDKQMWI